MADHFGVQSLDTNNLHTHTPHTLEHFQKAFRDQTGTYCFGRQRELVVWQCLKYLANYETTIAVNKFRH